jgi:SAM-dependent methyltransferase
LVRDIKKPEQKKAYSMLNLAKKYAKHFLEPFLHLYYPLYEERFKTQLKTFENKTVEPKEFFRNADDRYFFWLMTFGNNSGFKAGGVIPEMPPAHIQRNWTGSAGETTMKQAFAFYGQILDLAKLYGSRPIDQMEVLDFGCGWGRILRFFLRDVPHEQLHGRDCWQEAVDICQKTNQWCDFKLNSISPPMDFKDSSLDLIYLYSVFSHLSEGAHAAWIKEFHRILKPGGLVVVTTRPRSFLTMLARNREREKSKGLFNSMLATEAFPDIDAAQKAYDRGEYCFSVSGGGGGPLEPAMYGETCIPESYARKQWNDFEFMDSRYAGASFLQDVYCIKKT